MNLDTEDAQIYDPHQIFLYALEHAPSKPDLVEEIRNAFMVHTATIAKWASINDCSQRRNPIGACTKLFKIFWTNCRPAAFQIQAAFKELEMNSNPTTQQPAFNALELIQELRKATHLAEQLHAESAQPGAYAPLLSEVQAIGSIFTDRILARTPAPQPAVASRKLTFNPRTPEAYR